MADRTTTSRHATRSRAGPYYRGRPTKRDPSPGRQGKSPLALLTDLWHFLRSPWTQQENADALEAVEDGASCLRDTIPAAQALYQRAIDMDIEVPQPPEQLPPLAPPPASSSFTVPHRQSQPNLPPPPNVMTSNGSALPPQTSSQQQQQSSSSASAPNLATLTQQSPAGYRPTRNLLFPHLPAPQLEEMGSSGEDTSPNPLDAVSAFLAEKGGRPLNTIEYAGVLSLIEKHNQEITHEKDQERKPFRFSTSLSTPVVAAPPPEPRQPRMLAKNPNGPYRWNGAASARPRKYQNKYASPSFGTPKAKSGVALEVPSPDTKGKKRRVNGPAQSTEPITPSTSTSTIGASTGGVNGLTSPQTPTPAPAVASTSTATTVNGTSSSQTQENGTMQPPTTPPQIRQLQATKPTVPSPLRQAWIAEPNSSPSSTSSVSGSPRPTRAASAMEAIINETPKPEKKKREVPVNPYDGLNPKVAHVRKPPARKRRNVPTPEEIAQKEAEMKAIQEHLDEEDKLEKERERERWKGKGVDRDLREVELLSPEKVIEATMPKGAKRARPPPELEQESTSKIPDFFANSGPFSGFGTNQRKVSPPQKQPTVVVEVIDEDEAPRKKAKTGPAVNGTSTRNGSVTVEEVSDSEYAKAASFFASATPIKPAQVVEPDNEPKQAASSLNGLGSAKLTALKNVPKVSSKLRYSFQADKDEQSSDEAEAATPQEPVQGTQRARENTAALDLLIAAATVPPPAPRLAAATLPTSAFGRPSAPPALSTPLTFGQPSASASSSAPAAPATSVAAATPLPPSSVGANATMGSRPASTSTTPSSLTPSVSSPTVSSPKPSPSPKTVEEVKESVKALAVSELPVYTFDIPTSSPGAGPSTTKARLAARNVAISSLPVFDLSASGPAESSRGAPAASTGGFDWAAAGMKKPTGPKEGEWVCSACTLTNPASAKIKCLVCDSARPASTGGGFDWAAAGMKKPTGPKEGEWVCSACTLTNPASAKLKCIVCESARPGAATTTTGEMSRPYAASTSASNVNVSPLAPAPVPATAPAPAPAPSATPATATGGFNWAASGMKPPQSAGWTCGVCMISNKASATKCAACETDRP